MINKTQRELLHIIATTGATAKVPRRRIFLLEPCSLSKLFTVCDQSLERSKYRKFKVSTNQSTENQSIENQSIDI